MPESFGARLREQRERRQVSLASIAEQTKISASLLEALERDDVSRWPTGLFRRAFFRAYASAIGLDVEATLREFLAIHPDPAETVAVPIAGTPVPLPDRDESPTTFRNLVVGSLGRLAPRRRVDPQPDAPSGESAAMAAPEPDAPADESAATAAPETPWNPDVSAAAQLSTDLGRVDDIEALKALLGRASDILHGSGLIVWLWNPQAERLWPALTHGYSEKVLAHVPPLRRDDENATASVFRSGRPSIVDGGGKATGAVVVPLIGRGGCVGALAIEVQDRAEHNELVRALLTIFAAQVAPLVGESRSSDVLEQHAARTAS